MRLSTLSCFLVVCIAVLAPSAAHAFCGFYVSGATGTLSNDATMTVLMRSGMRTVLSMQNTYKGPPEDFALVIPVPVILQESDVKILPPEVFAKVDATAAPRLVEYWEDDPCLWNKHPVDYNPLVSLALSSSQGSFGNVKMKAQFKVGEYEIVILSADDSSALDTWLRANKYNIPQGAEAVLRPYIEQGMYFFVAKVDVDKVTFKDGRAVLSPLRFHYDTDSFSLPIRLGLLNADGPQELIVHILAPGQRYEVANYPNAILPTNLEVAPHVRGSLPAFTNALFDKVQEKTPRAVVTEYAWEVAGWGGGAGKCDPCPEDSLALNGNDFNLLGAEVLTSRVGSFVLTRLHARYTREQATEDLIFQAAPPIVGGHEWYASAYALEQGAHPAARNNFQARYVIRRPWRGPLGCEAPLRGRWDGFNGWGRPYLQGDAAAPFTGRALPDVARSLRSHVPELGLRASWTNEEALLEAVR